MNTKHARQKTGRSFRLSAGIIILLLGILDFASSSSPPSSRKAINVRVYTYVRPSDSVPFTAGKPISAEVIIGSYTATTSTTPEEGKIGIPETIITVPPGRHKVKARAEGYIVKEVYFSASYLAGGIPGSDVAGVPAASTEGDIEIEVLGVPEEYPQNDTGTLSFTFIEDPNKKEEKAFRVFAVSEEGCKDLRDAQAVFSRNGSETRFPLEGLKDGENISLEAGTYEVRIGHTAAAGPIQAELSKVRVSQRLKGSTQQLEFPADESGKAKVNLEKGMWDGQSTPEIELYVAGFCGEVGYIDNFSGEAWIDMPNSTTRKATYRAQVQVGETIRTLGGSSVDIKTYNSYLLKIGESTKLKVGLVKTASGMRYLERLIELEMGNIQIIRLINDGPPESKSASNTKPTGVSVKTPTATAIPEGTNYAVRYEENSKVTTVGVEEGKVEVTPTNTSLKPVTLEARQQVQVTENNVSSITAYTPQGSGSNAGRILLYVGIGVVSLVALVAAFLFFRRHHRLSMQPALHPAKLNVPGWNTPPVHASPVVNAASQRCSNPHCGKEVRAGKQFCAHCGTRLNV